jgi:hypothetical protein
VVEGEKAVWREVETGVTNVTHAEVLRGLRDGERVLLATDEALRTGMEVRAVSEALRR